MREVVVVGSGAAGLTAAETLRRRGFDGRLTLIGAESRPPYDRPPLSKQILAGTWQPDRIMLRSPADLAALGADLRLGTTASGLDAGARRVHLADGSDIGYDGLVIATGVRPRPLRVGTDLSGVHELRTLDDALALRADLLSAARVVVVGAGFLGTEIAAVARTMGADVTIIDPLAQPLVRQLGPLIGKLVARLHADHGVTVRTHVGVADLVGASGQVTGVALTDGTLVPADLVVVAIGSVPCTDWLIGSGIALTDGVDTDASCRAAPGIVAAGDVASWYHAGLGVRVRVEHRINATEQAMAAAATLLGEAEPFTPVAYFWSDQYDTKIHMFGTIVPGARMTVVDGAMSERRFAAVYTVDGVTTAALTWNMPRRLRSLRQHVIDRARIRQTRSHLPV